MNPSMALGASTNRLSSSSQIPKAAGIPPWDSTMARGRGRVRSSDSQPADPNSTRAQVHETGECKEAEHVHETQHKTSRPPPNFSGSGRGPDTRVKGGEPVKRQARPKQETSRARDGVGDGARTRATCAEPFIQEAAAGPNRGRTPIPRGRTPTARPRRARAGPRNPGASSVLASWKTWPDRREKPRQAGNFNTLLKLPRTGQTCEMKTGKTTTAARSDRTTKRRGVYDSRERAGSLKP